MHEEQPSELQLIFREQLRDRVSSYEDRLSALRGAHSMALGTTPRRSFATARRRYCGELPPYGSVTVDHAQRVTQSGTQLVVITNSPFSPLLPGAKA